MENGKVVKRKHPDSEAKILTKGLPQEIIIGILSRLPITSLMQSKLVCQAWRSLIQDQDPLLARQHFSNMADNDPSFILQSYSSAWHQLYFIDFSDHSEGKVIQKKLDINSSASMSLVDSCNGLLCMRDSQGIYICNPFTKLSIELPKLAYYPKLSGHLEFGFHPITKQYKIVQLVRRRQLEKLRNNPRVNESASQQYEVCILTIGSSDWRNIGILSYQFIFQKSKVMVNGRLHWLSRPNKNAWNPGASSIISFDLATEQFEEVPKPNCCDLDGCFQHLMVLRGCLSAVAYHDDKEFEVWVMKEYGLKESWVKEFNIGTYNLYQLTLKLEGSRSRYRRRGLTVRFLKPFVRVLGILRSGEILLEYQSTTLFVYDPHHGTLKEFRFPDMPNWFRLVLHVGSLNWLDTPIY